MKVRRKTKGKLFIGILIGLIIGSMLFFLSPNVLGISDDDDTEVTLHCTLETNSLELTGSNLMTIGTYSFYETPELDTGSFSHDSIRIDVTNIQYPSYNQTLPTLYNKTDCQIGNFTFNTTKPIEQYTLSAPFDSSFQVNISYIRNYTDFSIKTREWSFGDYYSDMEYYNGFYYFVYPDSPEVHKYSFSKATGWTYIGMWDLSAIDHQDDVFSIEYYNNYFYITDPVHSRLWRYTTDFSSGLKIDLTQSTAYGILNVDGYFYIIDDSDKIYKYTSSFTYISTYDCSGLISGALFDLEYYDGYWYLFDTIDEMVIRTTDLSSIDNSFSVAETGGSNYPLGILLHNHSFFFHCYMGGSGKLTKYPHGIMFDGIYIENFTYTKLGVPYLESYTPIYDSINSNFSLDYATGNVIYYFDSTFFDEYDYVNDIIITEQNLTLIFDLPVPDVEINMSIIIAYSTCEWKVPTEVALRINEEECIDTTYNSGFVLLDTFPPSLIITATDTVYFKLNITTDFSFTFNLEVISKTYLRKRFELESNHLIYIEQMNFDSNLNIKKIYLNNIDKGSSNPCSLSPAVSMNTGNKYTLEIILTEEIYLPLQYIYNNLGSGTSNLYLSGISNTLSYYNINGNHLYSIILPSGWSAEYGQLTFSNLEYLPDYVSNYTDDLSGYGYGSSSYGDEDVSWGERYYQTNQNGSFLEDSGGSGYENVYNEYFSTLNGYMSHNYGDLDGYNSTYSVNDYLYMQNLFPQELNYEDWLSWVLDYNSEYISSTWDNNGNLTSTLNTGTDLSVPLNTSFTFVNGTHYQNGSLWDLDGDYSIDQTDYISEWNYTEISFDISNEDTSPNGMVSNGTHFFMVGNANDKIFVYNSSFGYTGVYYDISGETTTPYGFCTNGTHFFLAGNTENKIFVYNSNFGYTGVYYDVSGQDGTPSGLVWDGSYFYMAGQDNKKIFVYNSNFGYTGVYYDVSGQDGTPTGLHFRGTHFYMVGNDNDAVFLYNSDWDYTGMSHYLGSEDLTPMQVFDNLTHWFFIGKTNDAVFMYDDLSESRLNFTSQFIFSTEGFYSNNTIESFLLFYSYKTDVNVEISFSIWNYDSSIWELINKSINKDNFFNFNFTLNSSYYDVSNTIKLKFEGNTTIDFELYIDKLLIEVNWTKTSGEIYATIIKDIDFSFLDRYDAEANYQKLFNVTIEFCYRYSNYTKYSEFAEFSYEGNSYTLIKDENWHTAILNFEFDSASTDHFSLCFNITNGLLELNSNINYTIFFKCLDITGHTQIYQFFRYTPSLSLDYLQRINGNWILNFSYSFTASSDLGLYNFYNSFNHSLLSFQIYVNSENGWEDPICFNYNTTQSNIDFTYNLTQYIISQGATQFNDIYLEFYLSGNPSNFTLDNLTLFDFDSAFYEVSAIWIDDTLVISHQNVSVFWKASDRYIDHIEIHQKFDNNIYLLYNGTLLNNTLQFHEFWNITAGFYELNLTFYDNFSNWERWTCNFTIWNRISISTAYRNPCLISETNTVFVHLDTEYSIMDIYYDNSTHYVHEYANSSYPIYQYEFNFTLNYSVETIYNLSILVVGEYNDSFWCNISGLSFIQRTSFLEINHLYYSYYQDEQMNVTFVLRDLYSNPVQNKLLNYTIEDPHGNFIVNGSGITNIYGNITYNLPFNISYPTGFYHLNISFNGTKDYTSAWKLQSFQVRPILRTVNSTDFNLTVNNYPVLNNFIQINWTNNFTIANNNTAEFDLTINLKLNYTQNITYSEYLDFEYTFSATSYISHITFDTANITNYPSNFTYFYYDNLVSTNYNEIGTTFQILNLVGDTFYNDNSFSIKFRYYENDIYRTQVTEEPRTDSNHIIFREDLIADRTFSYWYVLNSFDINTLSLNHTRTNNIIEYTDFTIEGSKHYFEESSLANDIYIATVDYNPGWFITHDVTFDNGTTCYLTVTYQANFTIENVTIVLDLSTENLYAENWTHSATQFSDTKILEIPSITFTTTQQTINLTGISSIPYATIKSYVNIESFDIDEDDYDEISETYFAFLQYPKYSKAFVIYDIQSYWTLDGVHYGITVNDIESNGYFECSGYGAGISTSYLQFQVNPIDDVKRDQYDDRVVYRIYCNLPCDDVDLEFYIQTEERFVIDEEKTDIDEDEEQTITKYYTFDDKTYFEFENLDLGIGKNEIVIYFEIHTMVDDVGFFILIGVAIASLIVIYYRKKILAYFGFDKRESWFLRIIFFWKKDMPEVKKGRGEKKGRKKSINIKKKERKKKGVMNTVKKIWGFK